MAAQQLHGTLPHHPHHIPPHLAYSHSVPAAVGMNTAAHNYMIQSPGVHHPSQSIHESFAANAHGKFCSIVRAIRFFRKYEITKQRNKPRSDRICTKSI